MITNHSLHELQFAAECTSLQPQTKMLKPAGEIKLQSRVFVWSETLDS